MVLDVGYIRVIRIAGAVVEVRDSGQIFRLHGIDVDGLRPGRDEVSVIATWLGNGDLQVQEVLFHPHRDLKKAASALGLVGWLGLLLWKRRG